MAEMLDFREEVDPDVAWAEYEAWCDATVEDLVWGEFGKKRAAVEV